MGPHHPHRWDQGRVSRHAMWRIAIVHHGSASSPTLAHLRQAFHRHGLIEGNNCIVDAAGVEGQWTQLPELVDQLLHRGPDVLVAVGGVAALTAQRATSRVPILHAIVLDPSDIGLVAPNVTGVTTFDPDQAMRHFRLLRQLVPDLRKLACLTDAQAPKGWDGLNPLESQLRRAATAQGIELISVAMPVSDTDLREIFRSIGAAHARALVALEVPAVLSRLGTISCLAERHRLPMLSPYGWPDPGVVMQGGSLHDAMEPLAEAVAALRSGVSMANLPLRTVRHHRLVIDKDRARRIGLEIPACLLDLASACLDELPSAMLPVA